MRCNFNDAMEFFSVNGKGNKECGSFSLTFPKRLGANLICIAHTVTYTYNVTEYANEIFLSAETRLESILERERIS